MPHDAPPQPNAPAPALARAAAAALAAALLPVAFLFAGAAGAAIRSTLQLPMPIAVAVGLSLAAFAWVACARQVWRQPPPPAPVLLTMLAAAAAIADGWQQLHTSALGGLVTVGGGDFGNHIYLTQQLAAGYPKAYQSCTSWHTSVWTLANAAGLPLPLAASVVSHLATAVAAGLASALAVAVGWSAGTTRLARTLGALVGGAAVVALWSRFGTLVAHYDLAEGFVAHWHALWVMLGTALALALTSDAWPRVAVALVGVVAMRFTYGINLPGMLLGGGLLVWLAQATPLPSFDAARWLPAQRRVALARGLALLLVGAGVYVALLLVGSWGKPGGVAHPNLMTRTGTLLVGWLATLVLTTRAQTRSLGKWLLVLLGIPLAVALLHLQFRNLSRAYFLWKHGHLSEVVGLVALAMALAAETARAVSGRWWQRAAVALALPAALLLMEAVRDHNPSMVHSLRERGLPPRAWRALAPLWDAGLQRSAERLTAQGKIVHTLHPHWPLYSLLASSTERAATTAISEPKLLHDERWAAFVDGLQPPAGHCVVFAAAPHRLAQWQEHERAHGGSAHRKVEGWLANAKLRCEDGPPLADGLPTERACWICGAEPAAPAPH